MKGLVIFDLDGTLLCTHRHLTKAVNETLREYGFSGVDDGKIKPLIGESSEAFYKNIAPGCKNMDNFISTFREKERLALRENGQLYGGVVELLSRLRREGFNLAICSNGSREYIELALNAVNIKNMFQYIYSSQEFISKVEAIHALMIASQHKNVVMVGDRYYDLRAAQLNHIPFISAMYGYGTANEMADSSFTAETPKDIFSLVMQLALYAQIYIQIKQLDNVHCVGINGVDTSGKTIFSNQFAKMLRSIGKPVVVVHLDDFHNPRALRAIGYNEIDAYIKNAFDLSTLLSEILCPIRQYGTVHKELTLLDLDSDSFVLKRKYDITEQTIVLLEGVLLYRQPIEDFIDFKIFLDIEFEEVIRRATVRDVPKYGIEFLEKYRKKYIPIQQWYLRFCDPKGKSDIVVDNSNPQCPRIL